MPDEFSWQVVGPLANRSSLDEDGKPRFPPNANARLVLHRTAVALLRTDQRTGATEFIDLDDRPVRTWAVDTGLGQQRGDALASDLAARRSSALELLALATGRRVMVVEIEPQAALITGTATGGIRNVGIELDGTHGWPIIPASGLKGVAAAYGADAAKPEDLDRIFGLPRPSAPGDGETPAKPGSVLFFDALPGPRGVTVAEHNLTPHARDYHMGLRAGGHRAPPAEYLNPVPIPFLVIDGGSFIAHLVGNEADVEIAAGLLCGAMDDIGVGAKTSAGYGYLTGTAR